MKAVTLSLSYHIWSNKATGPPQKKKKKRHSLSHCETQVCDIIHPKLNSWRGQGAAGQFSHTFHSPRHTWCRVLRKLLPLQYKSPHRFLPARVSSLHFVQICRLATNLSWKEHHSFQQTDTSIDNVCMIAIQGLGNFVCLKSCATECWSTFSHWQIHQQTSDQSRNAWHMCLQEKNDIGHVSRRGEWSYSVNKIISFLSHNYYIESWFQQFGWSMQGPTD